MFIPMSAGCIRWLTVAVCSLGVIFPVAAADHTKSASLPASSSVAKKECTDQPVSEWLSEEEFKLLIRHRGYKNFKFKIVYNSCYEIYGMDAQDQLIEAYFNPVNAKLNRLNTIK
ncbi:PepSY domain-containing protein [Undibacterium sp. SXout7W]|uniref:PepSY domain-containing protein n=1 Tax=Undibacterium sp. SXout7W TaxID=3413049 RepID=UPI003BF021E5